MGATWLVGEGAGGDSIARPTKAYHVTCAVAGRHRMSVQAMLALPSWPPVPCIIILLSLALHHTAQVTGAVDSGAAVLREAARGAVADTC